MLLQVGIKTHRQSCHCDVKVKMDHFTLYLILQLYHEVGVRGICSNNISIVQAILYPLNFYLDTFCKYMHTNAFTHTQTNKLTSHFVLGHSTWALATEEIVNYIPQSRGTSVNKNRTATKVINCSLLC